MSKWCIRVRRGWVLGGWEQPAPTHRGLEMHEDVREGFVKRRREWWRKEAKGIYKCGKMQQLGITTTWQHVFHLTLSYGQSKAQIMWFVVWQQKTKTFSLSQNSPSCHRCRTSRRLPQLQSSAYICIPVPIIMHNPITSEWQGLHFKVPVVVCEERT